MAKVDPEAVLKRVYESQNATLNDDEVAALERKAAKSLNARRLLMMHYSRKDDFAAANKHAKALFESDHSAEAAKNYLSTLTRTGKYEAALALTEKHRALFDPIELADGRCSIFHRMKRYDAAVLEGQRALQLKDELTPELDRPTPLTHHFNAERPERNIIAFSLFGTNPRYHFGALRNAVVIQYLYPGWSSRFYVDKSVPESVIKKLSLEGAQIKSAPKLDAARYGLFWRFLIEDDPDVDLYMIRDADSVCNIKERAAVQEWLQSGKPYHVMRDFPIHSEPMLAGMWGAHRGNLQGMGEKILKHVRDNKQRLNDRTTDQSFLRTVVWPQVRRDALVHDSWFKFRNARPFPSGADLPWPMHVGQNDHFRMVTAAQQRAER